MGEGWGEGPSPKYNDNLAAGFSPQSVKESFTASPKLRLIFANSDAARCLCGFTLTLISASLVRLQYSQGSRCAATLG
jgi:hypothetical protein